MPQWREPTQNPDFRKDFGVFSLAKADTGFHYQPSLIGPVQRVATHSFAAATSSRGGVLGQPSGWQFFIYGSFPK